MQKNMETKKEIRSCILKQRRAQSKETCEKSSMVIAEKLLALPEYRKAKNIYAYMDFSGEVKTEMILKESLRLGKNLWLPRVNGDIMDFFRVRSKDDFEIGAYGILEPKGESKAGKEEARDGFMVVPGVAFDADRNRIGFAVVTMINIWNYIRSFLRLRLHSDFRLWKVCRQRRMISVHRN